VKSVESVIFYSHPYISEISDSMDQEARTRGMCGRGYKITDSTYCTDWRSRSDPLSGRWLLPAAPTRVGGMGHKARTEDGAEPLTTNTTDTTDRDVGAVLEQGAAA